MKKHKKKLTEDLPTLKEVKGKLPYVFDLNYDIKDAEDIDRFGLRDNHDIRRLLAENGYDVKSWLKSS